MTYLKGDIVIVPFPFGDLSGSKPRPAIIISNSTINKTRDVILAQITSNIRNDEFSFYLHDGIVTNSLRGACEIRCNKIFTAEKSIITKKISTLKPDQHIDLYNKISELLS